MSRKAYLSHWLSWENNKSDSSSGWSLCFVLFRFFCYGHFFLNVENIDFIGEHFVRIVLMDLVCQWSFLVLIMTFYCWGYPLSFITIFVGSVWFLVMFVSHTSSRFIMIQGVLICSVFSVYYNSRHPCTHTCRTLSKI